MLRSNFRAVKRIVPISRDDSAQDCAFSRLLVIELPNSRRMTRRMPIKEPGMVGTVADLVADSLILNGISDIYCLPGFQNDDFFDAVYHRSDALVPISARHEQGAAYMALGAAMATGRQQAFCIVPGPGLLNASAALATAYSVNAPLLALVGHLPTGGIGRGYGLLHEIPEQSRTLSTLTKQSRMIGCGADAPDALRNAFAALGSGRPRPVGLEIPSDIWKSPVEADPKETVPADSEPGAIPGADLDRCIELLADSKRPMIYAGGGCQSFGPEVARLAESLSAPVTSFCMGHGVINSENPLCISTHAAHSLWSSVDVLLAIGTRLKTPQLNWGADDDLKIVHIDIDPSELGKITKPEVGICADLGDVLAPLVEAMERRPRNRSRWREAVEQAGSKSAARIAERLAPQIAWLEAIRSELPADGIFVEEITQTGFAARLAMPVYKPRTYISTGYQGTLGFGLPTAIGAAHARRDVPVVSISGDGGALFAIGELATAVHYEIPLTAIIFKDDAYGNVKMLQNDFYGGRVIASDLTSPDFVELAESFGARGLRARTPEDLKRSVRQSMNCAGPTVIEVPVGDFPSPWEFIMLPKVRGGQPGESGAINPKAKLL